MLNTNPQEQFEELKKTLLTQISSTFPIQDRRGNVEVRIKDLGVEDALGTDDIRGQFQARVQGRSWAVPVTATVEVVEDGKVISSKPNVTLARLPKLTRHYSYIVAGQEKFVANQWRLRPGVYVRETQVPGQIKAQFQLAKGRPFSIQQEKGNLFVEVKGRKVPLYSLLSAQGVSDDEMKKAWGEDIFNTTRNKGKNSEKALQAFHTAFTGKDIPEGVAPEQALRDALRETKMDSAIAEANLGVATEQVNAESMLRASTKLLGVAAGKEEADPIDSLRYKELWTAADHFSDRLRRSQRDITGRVQNALSKPTLLRKLRSGDTSALRDVVMPDLLQKPIYHTFATSLASEQSLSSNGSQVNPLAMLADRSTTTIRGPGGVTNAHQIKKPNQVLDPSHLGFLDPVFTPEGDPGVTTHLAAGVRIKDRKPHIRLYNLRTGKTEDVDAARAATAVVVLPDQVKWKGGKPSPLKSEVRMSDRRGSLIDAAFSKADYVMLSPAQVFSVESNLVPFMQNDSAGRTSMSARHMAQAISIVGREAPVVQVEAGKGETFEKVVGSSFLSHKAPVDGVVKEVVGHKIVMQDAAGKTHRIDLYKHYPTNHEKGQLHSTPLVKPGDKVRKGQILADNNHTKDGVLALGTNLRVAYIANGGNHEDGIVISESAAAKLKSEHLYKPALFLGAGVKVDKKSFLTHKGIAYGKERLENIGDDGLIKPGTIVRPGDPLILAMGRNESPTSIAAQAERKFGKSLQVQMSDQSLIWDGKYDGEVVRVSKAGKQLIVHVKTLEPAQVGSKISTRHSAKGIVTQILPDSEMPQDGKGKAVQMLLNPMGVPGRMNAGQILETAAGRIAEKTGKPYVIKNFSGGTDYLKKIRGDLKKHGVTETETLFDPKTGRKLGEVTVGPHYVFQLEHQIDKKTHYRSGGRAMPHTEAPKMYYDQDTKIPRGGGLTGAQSLGTLGVYGALAAGLKDNLREMQTLKSDEPQALEVWGALISGDRIPPPQVPFAYKKFEAMLEGLGVDLEKDGASIRIMPKTDDEVRKRSAGVLRRPSRTIRGTTDHPEKGGLFDTEVTGGLKGRKWSHIELAEPMPNPIYAKSLAHYFNLDARAPADSVGQLVAKRGGTGIRADLKKMDVDKEMKRLETLMADPSVKGPELNKHAFLYKSLRSAKEAGKHPADIWTMKAVPVLPPQYRPQAALRDGSMKNHPLNQLYRRLGIVNESLEKGGKTVPFAAQTDARVGLYQELQNLFGTTPKGKKALDLDFKGTKEDPNKALPGILHMISGESPKDGFFQKKLVGKRQDYTARATIVADPNLSADEVGVPKKIALELYRPMVAKRLIAIHGDPDKAMLQISRKEPVAIKALEAEIANRPLMLKRDPVLHQYSLVGQKVKLTDEPAIKVSPLILPPIGGDVDGDTVAMFVPLTSEAVAEVNNIMPSKRPVSESSGDVLLTPTNESALSLVRMSTPVGKTAKPFRDKAEAEKAFLANKIDLNTLISAGGKKTTLGRLRIAEAVPAQYRKDVIENINTPFSRKEQERILKETALKTPGAFLETADKMTQLGFRMAYESGHSVTLADLEPLRGPRDAVINKARSDVRNILRKGGKEEEVTQRWLKATDQLHDTYTEHYKKKPTNISDMRSAGIKAKKEQFQGLLMAPMLIQDPFGRASKVPITKSFSEGIDLGGYFMQAAGARGGQIDKTQSVREPGYMSKLLVQANIDTVVNAEDCGTTQGILMPISERDVVDRFLAGPLSMRRANYKTGTAVTPEMLSAAKSSGVDKVLVRSPLKCRLPNGVCSRCMGIRSGGKSYAQGEMVGLVAAQALGERAAQLMLKQTHGGGIMSTDGKVTDQFGTVDRLFGAADRTDMDAVIAPKAGKVTRITQWQDGTWAIHVSGSTKPLTSKHRPTVKPGQAFQRGEQLTAGEANINSLLATKGMGAAQSVMAQRIGDIYAREGVLRRHSEVAVRTATSMVRITDPGDYRNFVRGDHVTQQTVDEINSTLLKGKRPIKYVSVLKATGQMPLYSQKDFMARLQGEQLGQSLTRAIQHGERSDLAGRHPIPGLAHGARFGRQWVK